MKVEIEMKGGRRTKVHVLIARHLQSRKLATVIGEMPAAGAYQTRALAPAKPKTESEDLADLERELAELEAAENTAAPELDSAGTAWNAELHVSTKLQNADGTWRKKPGARASAEG